MAIGRIVKEIPKSLWEITSEKLIDLILNSPNADKMPSDLAKTILYYWQRDQLKTEVGLERLLEASLIVDPEATTKIMEDLGLRELTIAIREAIK